MNKLLVITFAISSLLRPSLVLCMETTGDVRVEYRETFCCASPTPASSPSLDSAAANECDGCLDVSLSTHSLAFKRTSAAPVAAGLAFVLPAVTAAQHATVLVHRSLTDSQPTLHSLSTTVIRR